VRMRGFGWYNDVLHLIFRENTKTMLQQMKKLPKLNSHFRQLRGQEPRRGYIATGLAVVVGSSLALYALKAFQDGMQAENERLVKEGNGPVDMGKETVETSKGAAAQAAATSKAATSTSAKLQPGYLGLDFGSTYSKIGHWDTTSAAGAPILLQNAEGHRAIPCCLYRLPDGKFSIGTLARSARYVKPHATAFSPTLLLGAALVPAADVECYAAVQAATMLLPFKVSPAGIRMEGQVIPVKTLVELVAADMVKVVTSMGISGAKNRGIPPAVISYPSFFGVDACRALEEILSKAGVHTVDLVPDAVSAYIGAIEAGEKVPGRAEALAGKTVQVAVVDVGGRLCQICLLRVSKDAAAAAGLKVQLMNEKTIFDMGGEFVDEAIAQHFASKFKEKHGVDLMGDPQAKQRLSDAAEAAKKDLTRSKQTSVNIPYITATAAGTLHLDQILTRAQLQSMLDVQEARVAAALTALLTDPTNTGTAPLAGVLLSGGSSRMQFVRRAVEKATGMAPLEAKEPESLSAAGAAAYARYKSE